MASPHESSPESTSSKPNTSVASTDLRKYFSRMSSAFTLQSKRKLDMEEGGKSPTLEADKAPSKDKGLGSERQKYLIRSRVEPKVFFANERTFLSWLSIAILLLFTSLSLLAVETYLGETRNSQCAKFDFSTEEIECRAGQLAGAITAPLAIIIMIYALWVHRKRTFQILRRDMVRIDDQCGPTILTLLLVLVMTLAYILSLIAAFRDPEPISAPVAVSPSEPQVGN